MDVYAVAISAMRHYSDGTGATTIVAPGLLRVEVGSDPHEEALASAAREFPQTDGWHSHKVGTVRVPDDWLCQCKAENARLRAVAAAADALAQYLRKGIPQAPQEDIHTSNIENNARLRYLDTRRVLAYAQAVENALAASEAAQ